MIPNWDRFEFEQPSRTPTELDHGYDETKPETDWTLADFRQAAQFRGGRCCSEHDLGPYEAAEWICALGHDFSMSPNLMLRGGHWCPTCMIDPTAYDDVAGASPFFAQVWREGF